MDMIYNASFAGLDWVQNAMHVLVKIHSMRLCSAHHKWVFIIVFRNVEKLLCWGHFSDSWCCGVHHESEAGAGVQEIMITWRHQSWAWNDPSAKFSQSWRASLLGPSPGWKHRVIIYGGTVVRNDDSPATLNLLLFLFSGGSLYTNQRRQRRRPHKLLFQLSFASSGGEKYNK